VRGPEKAGVGGSTPSLATIIPKDLDRAISLTPVRSQCAFMRGTEGHLRNWITLKNLDRRNSSAVRFQSALVSCVAENRREHFPSCSHAIPTDRVRVELKRKLDVAVAKQRLHGFWIGSDTDEKRRETVAQIMKTESSWVIIDQLSPGILV
jgi:hypothetical protein